MKTARREVFCVFMERRSTCCVLSAMLIIEPSLAIKSRISVTSYSSLRGLVSTQPRHHPRAVCAIASNAKLVSNRGYYLKPMRDVTCSAS